MGEGHDLFFSSHEISHRICDFLRTLFEFFFFLEDLCVVSLVLIFDLEHFCPWPPEVLSSESQCLPSSLVFSTPSLLYTKLPWSKTENFNCNYSLFTKLPGPEDSEEPIDFQVKLTPAHLSSTQGVKGSFSLRVKLSFHIEMEHFLVSFSMLNIKQESYKY